MRESTDIVAEHPGLVRVAAWERYSWLRAGFSTRLGGHSQAYGENEQNLGWTAEDNEAAVRANRRAFVQALGQGSALELVTVSQVHGAVVHELDHATGSLMTADGRARLEGDGLVTSTPGRLLAILTADCVPILFADTRTHAVGAVHAGWRGTLAGIVGGGIAAMQRSYGSRPGDLIAALGPCIRACCFEVGDEVQRQFEQRFEDAASLFARQAGEALHMDLLEANRRQLLHAGLAVHAIQTVGECTACARTAAGRRRYFSYRSEQGRTGRMLSGIAAAE